MSAVPSPRIPEFFTPLRSQVQRQLRRWSLWSLLVVLVLFLVGTLVWLAGRYEASQVQIRLERDAADALTDIRGGLSRNLQSLQALQSGSPSPAIWSESAVALMRERREFLRIEWRDKSLGWIAFAETPYRPSVFDKNTRVAEQVDVEQACSFAKRSGSVGYSPSHFVPSSIGLGQEVMEVCLPLQNGGDVTGYIVATYSLQEILIDLVGQDTIRSKEVSFTESDGTRLAMYGSPRRGGRVFTTQQILDLPGNTMVLRMDSWRAVPDIFPNILTALVTAMSIALVSVVVMLVKDNRLRLRAERALADALAFRKAMEDSLVTGLRARDLEGRITYVNPAFCEMVGYPAEKMVGKNVGMPYWPPELADEYEQRMAHRLAGNSFPREGFESTFMRSDGSRFPVLIFEAPLIDAQGTQSGWMSAFIDMSELRRTEELSRASHERLQATARLATVGEMASLLSHELNQPLAAIASYATGSLNLIKHDPTAVSEISTAMKRIGEQAERAGRVIKSVNDFVRRRDQDRRLVKPRALFDSIFPLISLQARKLRVDVVIDVPPNLPEILCDQTMIEQVVLNLARNGMQAMDLPELRVRTLRLRAILHVSEAGQRFMQLRVEDRGPGISEDVAAQLFTPFFTTKPEGMGLGLSLCRTVTEQHGGSLTFEPNHPTGTIFIVLLPL